MNPGSIRKYLGGRAFQYSTESIYFQEKEMSRTYVNSDIIKLCVTESTLYQSPSSPPFTPISSRICSFKDSYSLVLAGEGKPHP